MVLRRPRRGGSVTDKRTHTEVKLYLSVMGGIDVDHAWDATEREEEE